MEIQEIRVKIRGINLVRLFQIVLYNVAYRFFLLIEKICCIIFNKKIKKIPLKIFSSVEIDTIHNEFRIYYEMCHRDIDLLKCADEILNDQICLFGSTFKLTTSDWLMDPISRNLWDNKIFFSEGKIEKEGFGDVKYVMEYNKMYHLVYLAQAYNLTSDEKYIVKIEDSLMGWIKCVKHEKTVVNMIMQDIAFRCINLLHITLLCLKSSYFQQNVISTVFGILNAEEIQIRKFSTPRWFKYSTGTNHTIGEMVGLVTMQLWLERYTSKNYSRYLRKEFVYLNRCLTNIITCKGVYLEQSAGYSRLVTEFLVFLDIMVKAFDNEVAKQFYEPKFTLLLLKYIDSLAYHDQLPDFGDGDSAKVLSPFNTSSKSIEYLLTYKRIFNPSCQLDGKENRLLICYDSGQYIWKSRDEKDVYIFTRAGPFSFMPIGGNSHSHNDILSVIISLKGREFLIDKGTFLYNSGLSSRNEDRATFSHNTISAEYKEQADFLGKWSYKSEPLSKIISVFANDVISRFEGECLYSNLKHTRSIVYKRSIIHIKDTISGLKGESKICLSFLLASDLTSKYHKEGNKIDIIVGNALLATMIFDKKCAVIIEDSDYSPSFGLRENTHRIVCRLRMEKLLVVYTSIILYG